MKIPFKQPRSLLARIALWGLLAVVVLCVGGFFYLRSWLGAYLQSEAFRDWLGRTTSQQLDARCEYEPFHFSGLAVKADGFKAQGTEKAAFSTLELDKIRTAINLAGLRNKALEIDDLTVDRLRISLGHTGAPPVPESEIGIVKANEKTPSSSRFTWFSPKLDLRKVVILETNLLWGENTPQAGSMTKTEVTVKPNGEAWNIVLKGGTVSQHGEPDFTLDHVYLHYQRPIVDLSEGLLKFPAGGDIGLTGQVNTEKSIEVHVKINGVPVTPFLPPDEQSRLRGSAFADITVTGPMPVQNALKVSGVAHLENAELEKVPVLDTITSVVHSPQLANVPLTTASAKFTYAGEKLTVTDLIVEKKGLLCVTGHFVISNSRIDGHFQIGLPRGLLAPVAILQTAFFKRDEGGYCWAPDNVTGPLSSPSNDLLQHLVSALPEAALGEAENLLKNSPKVPEAQKKALEGLFKNFPK